MRPAPAEMVVGKRGRWRVVCATCMDEMVAVWGWTYGGLALLDDGVAVLA